MKNKDYPTVNYDAHARTVSPIDYWAQVKRTVHGKPVSDDQIDLIHKTMCYGLDLQTDDVVLDLACGNGALSRRLFSRCAGCVGIDISPYLIDIANRDFSKPPLYVFQVADVAQFLGEEVHPDRFTKALCYGSFQYFPKEASEQMLCQLYSRFTGVRKVFIGNVPDKERHHLFYTGRVDPSPVSRTPG